MTKATRILAGLLLLAAGVAAGWALRGFVTAYLHKGSGEADEAGADEAPVVPPDELQVKVKTALAIGGDLPIVTDCVGAVRAEQSAASTISSRAFGRVIETPVAAGKTVKKGDMLVRFEIAPLTTAVAEKHAALQLAENQLAEFDRTERDRHLVELRSAAQTAASELRLADAQLARLTPLLEGGLVASKVVDEARQAAEKAKQDNDRAAVALRAFETNGAALQRASLEAAKTAAAAGLRDAEAVLAEADVHAPADGLILSLTVRPGDRVEALAPLGALLRTGARIVVFGVPASVARTLRRGAAGSWLDAGGELRLGVIDRIAGEVNASTGLIDVIVVPDPGPEGPTPGLIVKGALEIERMKDVVLVPVAAVVRSGDRQVVVLATPEGAAKVTAVRVVGRHAGLAGVAGEVKAGDRVVVEGGYNLPDGAHIVDEGAASQPASQPAETRREGNGK